MKILLILPTNIYKITPFDRDELRKSYNCRPNFIGSKVSFQDRDEL